MGFGAGHIQDMNNRMKQFQANRPSARKKFKEDNREAIYSEEKIAPDQIVWDEISPEQLRKVREQIRLKAEAEQKQRLKVLILSFVITGLLLYLVFALYG